MRVSVQRLAIGWLLPLVVSGAALAWSPGNWSGRIGVWLLVATACSVAVAREHRNEALRSWAAGQLFDRLKVREAHARGVQAQLEAELVRLTRNLADPATEARRKRIRILHVRTEISVGGRRVDVTLRDLTLGDLWLEVPDGEDQRWVPGLPVSVKVTIDQQTYSLGWATADARLNTPPGHPPTWRLRWQRPMRETDIPRTLWRAVVFREAHRVRPGEYVSGAILLPNGSHRVTVVDLSAGGVGVVVNLDGRQVGIVPRAVVLELRLPDSPTPLRLTCQLRHVDVQGQESLLGLAFDPTAPGFAEHQPRIASHVIRCDANNIAVTNAPLRTPTLVRRAG